MLDHLAFQHRQSLRDGLLALRVGRTLGRGSPN